MSRDTAVVVQELFQSVRRSVLVSSFVVDERDKAEALFGLLAKRMDEEADLSVRLYLNVQRKYGDETADSVLLKKFADRFRHQVWPGERLPEVYHDPRALAVGGKTRACLHAKCIVVDEDRALVSSAHFTEAQLNDPAQEATVWGITADPDHDGLTNDAEFALDTNPTDPTDGNGGVTYAVTEEFGAPALNMTFLRRNDDPDLTVTAKICGDLNCWTDSPSVLQTISALDQGNGYERVTVREIPPPVPTGSTFGRIEIERTVP